MHQGTDSAEDLAQHEEVHTRACPCMLVSSHRVGFHLWQVVASLQAFQHASELQKVALEVIAYSTPPSKMAELRQLFHHMDTDDTGSITKEQFRHAMSQHPEIPLAQVDLMFASMDQTHTGQVDYTEFMAACLFSHRRRFETGASLRPQPRVAASQRGRQRRLVGGGGRGALTMSPRRFEPTGSSRWTCRA